MDGTVGKKGIPARFPIFGFTLAELIVVITILAILATVGFLALSGYSQDAKDASVKTNVRSVQTAMVSEAATSGNSPRYYVVHDTWAALSGAFAYVDGTPVVLTWGAWNQAETNYSAGNPDYAKLKLNPEKFKITGNFRSEKFLSEAFGIAKEASAAYDSKNVTVGAFDWTSNSNGKIRVGTYFQIAGISPANGAVSITGNYPGSSGTAKGLVRDPYSASPVGALTESVPSGNAGASARTTVVWDDAAGRKWSDGSYASNCMEYMNAPVATKSYAGAIWNGVYWIDPTGGSDSDAFKTYCDMTTNGGGWTQALWINSGATVVYADVKTAFLAKTNLNASGLFLGNALTQNSPFTEIAMDYVTTAADQPINPNYYSIVPTTDMSDSFGSAKYVFSFVMSSTGTTYSELGASDIKYHSLGYERSWNRPSDINRICNVDQWFLSPGPMSSMRPLTGTLWWFSHCHTAWGVFAIRWNPVSFRASDFDTVYPAVKMRGWIR